jgi:hypothetical protein
MVEYHEASGREWTVMPVEVEDAAKVWHMGGNTE